MAQAVQQKVYALFLLSKGGQGVVLIRTHPFIPSYSRGIYTEGQRNKNWGWARVSESPLRAHAREYLYIIQSTN